MAEWLRRRKLKVLAETGYSSDAPSLTTLKAEAPSGLITLVEAQGSPRYTSTFRELVHWVATRRHYCVIYLATKQESTLSGQLLSDLKRDGVGLLLVDENKQVDVSFDARNPALVVTPDPTLKLGKLKNAVNDLVTRFNEGDRKVSLREMCDLVEGLNRSVAVKAARKQWIKKNEKEIEAMDWSARIDVLASAKNFTRRRTPLITTPLKHDLHSFRGARNLVGHPAKGKRQEAARERQFAERMMMGPRLVTELISIERKIK